MKQNDAPIEILFEKVEYYCKTSLEIFRLEIFDKTADVTSSLVSRFTIITFLMLFVLTANIGIALWIGSLLEKTFYGFFVVAGIYLFISILFYYFRNSWLKMPVSNFIISKLLKIR